MFFFYIGVIGGGGGGGIGFVIGILFLNLIMICFLVMSWDFGFELVCNWKSNIIIYWIIVLYINWLKFVFLKIKWNYS